MEDGKQKLDGKPEVNVGVLPTIGVAIIIPMLIFGVYMTIEKMWLFSWMRDWQLDLLGYYYYFLTAGLTVLICMMPGILLVLLANKKRTARNSNEGPSVQS